MGRILTDCVKTQNDFSIVGLVDALADDIEAKTPEEVKEKADVIIDFSHHSLTAPLLDFAIKKKTPVVIATTGHTDEEKAAIKKASEIIPVFFSSNMSLGIAVLTELVKKAVAMFPDADVELIEAHHNRKLDAPSGTCLSIAEAIREVRPDAKFVFGRHGMQKREKNEIGVHAIRMGNEAGMHQVLIGTDAQTLKFEHQAESRAVFAEGAISAARFLAGKKPGLYAMPQLLEETGA